MPCSGLNVLGEGREVNLARILLLDEDPVVDERGDFNLDLRMQEIDTRHHALRFEVLKPIGERVVLSWFTGLAPSEMRCIVALGHTFIVGKMLLYIA
jgi:hypothetical protein